MDRSPRLGVDSSRFGESGASLILALIFMVVVSLIVLAMATWTTTGLHNAMSFTAGQSNVSTANSVADLAIQDSRSYFLSTTLDASPGAPCWSSGPTPPFSTPSFPPTQPMSAWCSTQWNPSNPAATRRVTVDICPNSTSSAACATAPFLLVFVTFDDYSNSSGGFSCQPNSPVSPSSTCGTYMKINRWVYGAVPPTITTPVTTPTLPSCTTKLAKINGAGFIQGSTNVYFVVPTVGTPPNPTFWGGEYASTAVTWLSATSLTACEPTSAISATNVMVSTPVGQSGQAALP